MALSLNWPLKSRWAAVYTQGASRGDRQVKRFETLSTSVQRRAHRHDHHNVSADNA